MSDDQDKEQHDSGGPDTSERPKRGKSTGTRTKKGKATSKFNALRHGLTAKTLIIPGLEKLKRFKKLFSRFRGEFRPKGPVEEILVEDITRSYWRLHRCLRAEATAFAMATEEERERQEKDNDWDEEETIDKPGKKDAPDVLSFPEGATLKKRAHYEREMRGHFHAAIRELHKLQRARKEAATE